jgi:hypothetical protein
MTGWEIKQDLSPKNCTKADTGVPTPYSSGQRKHDGSDKKTLPHKNQNKNIRYIHFQK